MIQTQFHIIFSIITFVVLCIAGIQALTLAVQDYFLHHQTHNRFTRALPPLLTMEKKLFQIVWLGFLLLTVLLGSSLYTFHHLIECNTIVLEKTLLTALGWVVFAILLLGRECWGWRGRVATYGTLFGVWILVVIYLSSALLLRWFA